MSFAIDNDRRSEILQGTLQKWPYTEIRRLSSTERITIESKTGDVGWINVPGSFWQFILKIGFCWVTQ